MFLKKQKARKPFLGRTTDTYVSNPLSITETVK